MPAKKKTEAAPAETAQTTGDQESSLVKAAKTIGRAAGKLAVKTGIEHATPSSKKGKLAPKNKKRLPRREKKALQKSAASRV